MKAQGCDFCLFRGLDLVPLNEAFINVKVLGMIKMVKFHSELFNYYFCRALVLKFDFIFCHLHHLKPSMRQEKSVDKNSKRP